MSSLWLWLIVNMSRNLPWKFKANYLFISWMSSWGNGSRGALLLSLWTAGWYSGHFKALKFSESNQLLCLIFYYNLHLFICQSYLIAEWHWNQSCHSWGKKGRRNRKINGIQLWTSEDLKEYHLDSKYTEENRTEYVGKWNRNQCSHVPFQRLHHRQD